MPVLRLIKAGTLTGGNREVRLCYSGSASENYRIGRFILKIAMVVPWEETTPPKKYGGIELVANNIAFRLRDYGHDVTILATGDSEPDAKLLPIFEESTRKLPQSSDRIVREAYTFLGISRVINVLRKQRFDIVHNHLGWRFLMFRDQIRQPMLTTIHLNLDNKYEQDIYRRYAGHPFVSISKSQREPMPELNYVKNIYNGIRVFDFNYQKEHEGYLAFLGSFTAHKGPDKAIEIAKKSGKKLIMAGKIDPLKVRWFDKHIKPHIDDKQIVFVGELDHAEKNKLLGGAEALLMPISWREPFGLVMAEALACGTPVVATRLGSAPEVIKNNKSGFLCDDIDCMVSCVKKLGQIKRSDCRHEAVSRFSTKAMTEKYIQTYRKIIREEKDYRFRNHGGFVNKIKESGSTTKAKLKQTGQRAKRKISK
jgi:glycosyltransferase involved in cell wall biosynthesis